MNSANLWWRSWNKYIAVLVGLILLVAVVVPAILGRVIGPSVLHPVKLNPVRIVQTDEMLARDEAIKEDFVVTADDGVLLRGWKIRPVHTNGSWILLLHGVSDNRTGMLRPADFLLHHGYSIVLMDSRAHGESGGAEVTYGWKERGDLSAIVAALQSSESPRHVGALGVSMGAAITLQAAAVEPRIEAVVAEDPFADLREVSYDYAGLEVSPFLGKTLFRPATISALNAIASAGGFPPDEVSPERAVASRAFPVLLICGTRDHRIPCRHAERIYSNARGPKELWVVQGAGHAGALGHAPAEYERRVTFFFDRFLASPPGGRNQGGK
jgi:pimeloyl-ACP methyl ester carboxylesterase